MKKYAGMTVNERLWVSGLFEEFESAIRNKNVKQAVEILRSVELDDESIRANLKVSGIKTSVYDNLIKDMEEHR